MLEDHTASDLESNWIVSGDLCPEIYSEADVSGGGKDKCSARATGTGSGLTMGISK